MEKIIYAGLLLIVIGFAVVFIGSLASNSNGNSNLKSAGGIFIGPIPVLGFASDKKMLYILFAIGVALFVISYVVTRVL